MTPRFPARTPVLMFLITMIFAGAPVGATTRQEFDGFAERYLDGFYAFHPGRASRDGIHGRDAEVNGYTRDQILAEAERLRAAAVALGAMRPADLDSARLMDHAMLTALTQDELLDLEEIRPWQKDPGWYLALIFDALHPLASRPVAPEDERLRNIIAREKKISEVLSAAVENVSVPSRIRTEAAIDQAKELAEYLDKVLPTAFPGVTDTALVSQFRSINALALRDLNSFRGYLEDVLPGSSADFKLGTELFEKKLRFREMCDIPLYRIERHADQELRRLQLSMKNVTASLDREKTPSQLLRILSIDYPRADRLLAEVDRVAVDVRDFCATKGFVPIPAGAGCRAMRTPFRRWLTALELDAPGAFEKNHRDGILRVTMPEPGRKPLEADEMLRCYNRYQLPLLVASEAWPGALVESELRSAAPSRVRKALPFALFTEGWRAYVRGALIDAGYVGGADEYELFQLNLDVIDACRCLTAIRMHTGTMTFDDAVKFFETEASLSRVNALREARRAALDPLSIAPLLGRLQITKLREDYRRQAGASFTPRAFHDRILSFGAPPPRLLRQMLMPGDKGSVL